MGQRHAGCICVNGRFLDPEKATISVLDAGFLLGDGLFESLRAVDGAPYLLDRHLQRLLGAATDAGFANLPSPERLHAQAHETLSRAALSDAYLRITITRGIGGVGLSPPTGPPTAVIAALPAPAAPDHAINVTLLHQQYAARTTAKSTSWQHAVLARRKVTQAEADEGFYVSETDHVQEGVTSNVFIVESQRLLTPPITECLPGITRARVLELAAAQGIATLETPISVAALMRADEVFVTNAVQGLRRVATIGGTPIGKPELDGILATLRRSYQQDRASALELAT